MASPTFHLADLAYAKLILHALKYPHQSVNGVLLGSSSAPDTVQVVDAVPLQHHWTSLSPMMEIGLGMVRVNLFLLFALCFSFVVD
jgi:ER membrane protein complex subunit 8/9